MVVWMGKSLSAAGMVGMMALLVACTSTQSNTANLNTIGAPPQAQPVQSSTVSQGNLPALGAATGTPAPGLAGQPVLGGVPATPTTASAVPPVDNSLGGAGLPPLGAGTQTASAGNSSFVSLDPLGQPAANGIGAGPEGTWTVVSGATQCQLNLPLTPKTGTSYNRASAPGCGVAGLSTVSGWKQVGQQLQLFDDNGNIAAYLAPSGGRYIGTLGGGQPISMQR